MDVYTGLVSANEVADYFSEHLGERVAVISLRQSYPGFSRQTWMVEAMVGGKTDSFILRLDPPWGASVPQSLRHEWRVYQALWGTQIPVGEPLWFDEGQSFARGRALMVRRLVEGSSTIPGLTEDSPAGEALRRRVVEDHIDKLARVHALDWRAHGFDEFTPAPASPREALRFEYDTWRKLWEERRSEPFPLITEFLCWLGEQVPNDTPRISLVKGNNGIGEEIFRDGRVVGMSDWELASLGDGVLDLAFSQGTLGLIGLQHALKLYEARMGEVSEERLAFAMLWIRFKAVVCINGYALWGLQHAGDFRTTCAALGYVSVKSRPDDMVSCLGKDLVTAWRDLQPRGRDGGYMDLKD